MDRLCRRRLGPALAYVRRKDLSLDDRAGSHRALATLQKALFVEKSANELTNERGEGNNV